MTPRDDADAMVDDLRRRYLRACRRRDGTWSQWHRAERLGLGEQARTFLHHARRRARVVARLRVLLDAVAPDAIDRPESELGELRAMAAEVLEALSVAIEPHDAVTREAATKALHALEFALDDLRRLR